MEARTTSEKKINASDWLNGKARCSLMDHAKIAPPKAGPKVLKTAVVAMARPTSVLSEKTAEAHDGFHY